MNSLLSSFERDRHVRFLEMMFHTLPSDFQEQEINRLTLAYFVISGLDILGALNRVLNHDFSHLASTYCALAILKTVGCSLSTIDSGPILMSMKKLQQPDGSFIPIHTGAEADLRFVYCAAAICYMLNDWNGMDRDKTKEYILACQSYDGGFGLTPGSESHVYDRSMLHPRCKLCSIPVPNWREDENYVPKSATGGATYCAVAALRLMGVIEDNLVSKYDSSSVIDVPLLLEWCLQRQTIDGGFQGRTNKESDTCYAFWVGGVLRIIGAHDFVDKDALRGFLLTCQSQYGGFSKFPGQLPDLYHSYFGFSAFGMLEEPGLKPLCEELGITSFAATGI